MSEEFEPFVVFMTSWVGDIAVKVLDVSIEGDDDHATINVDYVIDINNPDCADLSKLTAEESAYLQEKIKEGLNKMLHNHYKNKAQE